MSAHLPCSVELDTARHFAAADAAEEAQERRDDAIADSVLNVQREVAAGHTGRLYEILEEHMGQQGPEWVLAAMLVDAQSWMPARLLRGQTPPPGCQAVAAWVEAAMLQAATEEIDAVEGNHAR